MNEPVKTLNIEVFVVRDSNKDPSSTILLDVAQLKNQYNSLILKSSPPPSPHPFF